jgi:putative Mg2+ transporter-C (MgtC) family protein
MAGLFSRSGKSLSGPAKEFQPRVILLQRAQLTDIETCIFSIFFCMIGAAVGFTIFVHQGEIIMPYAEFLGRLVLAAVLGGAIGLEREIHGRSAGIRTYLILSLGTALLMVLSEYLLVSYQGKFPGLGLQGDPGRIAGQAITGIGFLGGGVIIRYQDSIRGLTTAACVWLVCSVGLAVGAGFYFVGVVVTILTLLALVSLKGWERRMRKDWFENLEVVSNDLPGQITRMTELIVRHGFEVTSFGLKRDSEKRELNANFRLRIRAVRPQREVLQDLLELEGVKAVELA